MGATIERDQNGIWILRVSGGLRKEELDAAQAAVLEGMKSPERAKVLVLVEESFSGWIGTEVWNDMTFFVKYGERLERIVIVGEAKWESRMLMFTGAGFRRTQIKFFTPNHLGEARAWLG